MRLLNASGCLDALTAPDVARSLDAFVTKTVTPLPREGNAPTRIAETDAGMLNSIGLANPGASTSSSTRCCRPYGPSAYRSGSPSEASPPTSTPDCARCSTTTARSRRWSSTSRARTSTRRPRAPHDRRPCARRRASRCSRSSRRQFPTWLRSPVPPRRGAGGLARQHHARARDRRADAPAQAGARRGRLLGTDAEADHWRRCMRAPRRRGFRSSRWVESCADATCSSSSRRVRHGARHRAVRRPRGAGCAFAVSSRGNWRRTGSLRQTMRAVLRTKSARHLLDTRNARARPYAKALQTGRNAAGCLLKSSC